MTTAEGAIPVLEMLVKLVPALLAGIVVGLFYFGVMWVTINSLQTARSPGVLLFVSYAGRLVVAVGAFYRIAAGQGPRLVAALIGFVLARFVLIAYIRPGARKAAKPQGGGFTATDA